MRSVRIGMDTTQVRVIMGRAAEVSTFQQEQIYHYTHQPGSSASYQIKFGATYKVIEMNNLD
ncbi:outer membrane protein assembly factor BamE [Hymenobacter negativus]